MGEAARQQVAPVITVRSERFGAYEVPEDRMLVFSEGLVGLPDARRFVLLDSPRPESPFRLLVCVDQPELGFVVCDPSSLWAGYAADLPRPPAVEGEVAALAIVTVPSDPRGMTANLMAPLVIDCVTRRGWQIVIDSGRYSTQHPLLSPPA